MVEERNEELKEREAFIRQLEETLRQSQSSSSRKSSTMSLIVTPETSPEPSSIPLPSSPYTAPLDTTEADPFGSSVFEDISPRSANSYNDVAHPSTRTSRSDSAKNESRVQELMRCEATFES